MSDDAGAGFSPEALAEKYRVEREKRLRADGLDQYVDLSQAFTDYMDDPHVAPDVRAPIEEDVDVLVVGAGFSGLLTGVQSAAPFGQPPTGATKVTFDGSDDPVTKSRKWNGRRGPMGPTPGGALLIRCARCR